MINSIYSKQKCWVPVKPPKKVKAVFTGVSPLVIAIAKRCCKQVAANKTKLGKPSAAIFVTN